MGNPRISRCAERMRSNNSSEPSLRTVPTIVTAHTFCASRDTRVSVLWVVHSNTGIFLRGLKLHQMLWYLKKKLEGTMHFSEIIKLQLRKKSHTLLYILAFLEILMFNYLCKMRGYPQFSFWIPITLAKIYFSRTVINRTKILRY